MTISLVHCLPNLLLLKHLRPLYTQGLIYVDRTYTLNLFLITLKKKKLRGRKRSRFREQQKHIFAEFSESLILRAAQKERFREKKISRISKCIENNRHALY